MEREYCVRQVEVCDKWIKFNQSEIENTKAELVKATSPADVDRLIEKVITATKRIASWEKSRENWLELAETRSK